MMSFPQVLVGDELVGGFQETAARRPVRPAAGSCCSRPPPDPRARLAALADVGPAAGRDHLDDRRAAGQARLAAAQVHQELVLEGARDAVGMAEVVDRRAARVDARRQRRARTASASASHCGERELARLAQRMDPRAEQRLVGVDVARRRRCGAGRAGTP